MAIFFGPPILFTSAFAFKRACSIISEIDYSFSLVSGTGHILNRSRLSFWGVAMVFKCCSMLRVVMKLSVSLIASKSGFYNPLMGEGLAVGIGCSNLPGEERKLLARKLLRRRGLSLKLLVANSSR